VFFYPDCFGSRVFVFNAFCIFAQQTGNMTKPIRILVATDRQFAPSVRWYRTQGPLAHFNSEEFTVTVRAAQDLLQGEEWAWGFFDVVLVEKYWTPEGTAVIGIAKAYGLKVWLDTDDNKQEIPQYNDASDTWANPKKREAEIQVLGMADLLTVSTEALKKTYGGANKNIVVIRNAWNDYLLPMTKVTPQTKPAKMAWRGSAKHDGDLEEVRRPFLSAFNNQLLQWALFGARPPAWMDWKKEQYLSFQPLYAWWQVLQGQAPDWMFVPLKKNNFNDCKSDCAALEQNVLAGGGVIAPMSMPEFNRPGVIRYKDNTHLAKIFEDIAKGRIDKVAIATEGQKYIVAERRLSVVNEAREEAVKALF
jgi:hypothetical protein